MGRTETRTSDTARPHHGPLAGALLSLALAVGCSPPEELDGASDQTVDETAQGLASDTLVDPRPTFLGIFRPAAGTTPTVFSRTEAEFLADMTAQRNADFQMMSLTTHVIDGQLHYSAVWWPHPQAGLPDQFVTISRTQDQFSSQYTTLTNQGFRLSHASTSPVGSTVYYAGIYNRGTGAHVLRVARTQAQFDADFADLWGRSHRLTFLATAVVNGQVRYTGVWVPSANDGFVATGRELHNFIAEFSTQWSRGLRLAHVSTFVLDDVVRYNGIWAPGGDAWIGFGQPEREFRATQEGERTRGSLMSQIVASHVEGLALNRLASETRNILAPITAGSATTVAHDSLRFRGVSGKRRTLANLPIADASTSARTNSASVSKTATAIAVLAYLQYRRIPITASVSTYFPKDWARGTYISSLTFEQLLNHTSGLRAGNIEDKVDYASLRAMIAAGRSGNRPTLPPDYRNSNYALFRIIMPYMRGFNDTGVSDKDTATANLFMTFMNDWAFRPAGLSTVAAKPAATAPTMLYPVPANNTVGKHLGDSTKDAGPAGFELSSNDIATMLLRRADGTLLSAASRALMDNGRLGWDAGNEPIRHGTFHSKGGMIPEVCQGRPCAINTHAVSFSNGVQVGVVINSTIARDPLDVIKQAYDASWVPMY